MKTKSKLLILIVALAMSAITMVDLVKGSPNVKVEGIVFLSIIFFVMYLMMIYIIVTVFNGKKKGKETHTIK